MATMIKIDTIFIPSFSLVDIPYKQYILKEEPKEVLSKIVKTYNVITYRELYTKIDDMCRAEIDIVDLKGKHDSVLDENGAIREIYARNGLNNKKSISVVYGLKINSLNEESLHGLSISGTVDNFEISFLKNKNEPAYLKDPIAKISNYIQLNLVDIIPNKLFGIRYGFPRDVRYPTIKSVDEYLYSRDKSKEDRKERKLEQVLEYASALLDKEVDVEFLKTVKINVPMVGMPYNSLMF